MRHDFNSRILEETLHRPWPMPAEPWIMTQTWLDLLFAHWTVDATLVRSKVPIQLDLDLFGGQAWVGVVPFHMRNVAPRGVPALPRLSAFPELNVRTYVRVGSRPGVYFFSLDAANSLAVAVARTLFALPYYSASMRVETVEHNDGNVLYTSRRTSPRGRPAEFSATYRATGSSRPPQAGSLEYFLTERYCLYTVHRARTYTLDIHHPPWLLQPAEATITTNTMANAAGIRLPDTPPLLHYSKRQDMVAWRMRRVCKVQSA